MKFHVFKNIATPTDWENAIYFDIETADNIEIMRKIVENELTIDEKIKYLNPANLKHLSAGLWLNDFDIVHEFENFTYKRVENAVIYYNKREIDVITAVNFLLLLADAYERRTFVAHNGKKFDFLIFIYHPQTTLRYAKNTFYLQKKRNYYKLVDTMDIAKSIGVMKLDELAQKFNVVRKNLMTATDINEYNANDVYVLMNVAKEFERLGFHATPTRTARLWLADVMKKHKLEKIAQAKISLDYIGGRTEVFKHFAKNINVFDANSLYPTVMCEFKFPSLQGNRVMFSKISNIDTVKRYIDKKLANVWSNNLNTPFDLKRAFDEEFDTQFILFVEIEDFNDEIEEYQKKFASQYFPFSYFDKGKRYFRLQKGKIYQVQGYEVAFLRFFNWKLLGGYSFLTSKLFFADEMRELYAERQRLKREGNDLQLLYKIIMNSSYGIFGLRDIVVKELDKYKNELGTFFLEMRECRKFGEKGICYTDTLVRQDVFISLESDKKVVIARDFSTFSVPLWATHITSCARFWLHSVMLFLTKLNKMVYYCDTDSVFTDADVSDFEKLCLLGNNLLEWKHETSIEKAFFFAPKSYILKFSNENLKIKAKGLGNALEKEVITQRVFKNSSAIVKNDVIKIDKRFVNPLSPTKKIPDNSLNSVWNDKELTFIQAFPHDFIISEFPEVANDYLKVIAIALPTMKNELIFV